MKLRALVMGAALAVGWVGCGLDVVGSRVDAPAADASLDVIGANVVESSVVDSSPPPVPTQGSSAIPISDLDAGADAAGGSPPPPFEILATTGGAFHLVTAGGPPQPCSTVGVGSANLVVKNLSADRLLVGWVSYVCYETNYGILPASTQVSVGTQVGHRWRVRRYSDATVLGDFTIDAPGDYTVIVR